MCSKWFSPFSKKHLHLDWDKPNRLIRRFTSMATAPPLWYNVSLLPSFILLFTRLGGMVPNCVTTSRILENVVGPQVVFHRFAVFLREFDKFFELSANLAKACKLSADRTRSCSYSTLLYLFPTRTMRVVFSSVIFSLVLRPLKLQRIFPLSPPRHHPSICSPLTFPVTAASNGWL